MNSYNNLCDRTQDIMYMLKFLNYAYNQPDSDHDLPMTNEEKTGGQLILFHIMKELETLDTDIRKYISK